MANRASSTARAVNVLGNSVRGLDYANWRKIFYVLILPVLTYGFPVYTPNKHPVGLFKTLQVAQNVMIRKLSGAFKKTIPVEPLHYLMAILPSSLYVTKLLFPYKDRVRRLPPFAQLRTLLHTNPAAYWRLSLQPETALSCILPSDTIPPPFYHTIPPFPCLVPL